MFILFLLPVVVARAQITYRIDGFSNQYYARVHLNKTSESIHPSYTKGWIAIYSKTTADTILKVNVDRMDGFIEDGPLHGKGVPKKYADQNDVFYKDVNFDGQKDFIIKNWSHQTSAWKNYKIYLAAGDGRFKYSPEFSELTDGERGMFTVNAQKQTLTVNHGPYDYSDYKKVYKVVDSKLKPVEVYKKFRPTKDSPFIDLVKGRVQDPGEKLDTHFYYYLNPDDKRVHEILTFPVKKEDKWVSLLRFKDRLMYVLTKADSSIEFHYGDSDHQDFAYEQTASGASLSFQKGVYKIFETPKTVGIKIHLKGKTYNWTGVKKKQKGRLRLLMKNDYKNVGRIFRVQDFSDRYDAKVFLKNPGGGFSPGWIDIYDKKAHSKLIRVTSDALAVDFKEDQVKANVQNLPYGEQSVLIYKDFNFDGKKDLAIEDGHHSCYGGPSYQIYLSDRNGFSHSKSFTALAQNYCGMFGVDTTTKTLHVMTKSGCCWHQSSVFKVENNQPKRMKTVEIDNRGSEGMLSQNKKIVTYENGKKKVKKKMKLDMNNMQVTENIIYELAFPSGKTMYLFVYDPDTLTYAYVNQEGYIELLYSGNFVYNNKEKTMRFTQKGVAYTIQGNQLVVKTPKDTYKHTGKQKSDFKTLHTAIDWGVKNVSIR